MSLSSFHVFWWTEHEFPPGFLPNQRNFPAKFIPKHECSPARCLSKHECPAGPLPKHEQSADHLTKRPCSAEHVPGHECPAEPLFKYEGTAKPQLHDCPARCPQILMLHKVPPTTVLSKLPLPSTDFDLPILYQDLSYSVLAIIIIGKKERKVS